MNYIHTVRIESGRMMENLGERDRKGDDVERLWSNLMHPCSCHAMRCARFRLWSKWQDLLLLRRPAAQSVKRTVCLQLQSGRQGPARTYVPSCAMQSMYVCAQQLRMYEYERLTKPAGRSCSLLVAAAQSVCDWPARLDLVTVD